jgi:hypothetical protein
MQTNTARRANLQSLGLLAVVALLAIGVFGLSAQTPAPGGSALPDPSVARKPKWPKKNEDGTVTGYTRTKENNYYKRDAGGKNLPGTDLYNFASLTGHFTNYDENDIPPYTLPDPLTTLDGRRVTSPEMWFKERRPELVKLFQTEIYGRVPDEKLPKIVWEVTSNISDGKTIKKTIVGRFEDTPKGVAGEEAKGKGGKGGNTITITLTLPAVGHPVPIFSGNAVDNPAAHGWGTFTVSGNAGVVARITPPDGQAKPGDFPGNYAVTAWAFSRAIDYFVTDKDVDARYIIIAGISTGGKQVLLTAAMDERIFCVVPQSSGAMGVKLNRRDVGETVDNLAGSFANNYCPNFKKWAGHWADMPTDQHEMIALMAPRKMFITGGNQELWQDVRGGFLACVAAEPVYHLLGKRGVAAMEMPPIETPIVLGEIGFYHHNGGHTFTANERRWVTSWMEKYLPTVGAEKGKEE